MHSRVFILREDLDLLSDEVLFDEDEVYTDLKDSGFVVDYVVDSDLKSDVEWLCNALDLSFGEDVKQEIVSDIPVFKISIDLLLETLKKDLKKRIKTLKEELSKVDLNSDTFASTVEYLIAKSELYRPGVTFIYRMPGWGYITDILLYQALLWEKEEHPDIEEIYIVQSFDYHV